MDEKLRQSLEQLHTELEQTQSLDDETHKLLEHLMQDIQTVLQSSSPKSYALLGKRLRDAIQELQESHPSLVLTIGRVLDHLAQV
jgi:hypothetical protein